MEIGLTNGRKRKYMVVQKIKFISFFTDLTMQKAEVKLFQMRKNMFFYEKVNFTYLIKNFLNMEPWMVILC